MGRNDVVDDDDDDDESVQHCADRSTGALPRAACDNTLDATRRAALAVRSVRARDETTGRASKYRQCTFFSDLLLPCSPPTSKSIYALA